jgi:hypothetical protein
MTVARVWPLSSMLASLRSTLHTKLEGSCWLLEGPGKTWLFSMNGDPSQPILLRTPRVDRPRHVICNISGPRDSLLHRYTKEGPNPSDKVSVSFKVAGNLVCDAIVGSH